MCVAAWLGSVSLALGKQAQSSAQASAQQSAPQAQQTGKPPSRQKAQAAAQNPQEDKQSSSQKTAAPSPSPASGQKAKATRQSPQPPKQASAQAAQSPPSNQQKGKQPAGGKAQESPSLQVGTRTSGQKAQVKPAPAIPPGYRLLSLKEGRTIVQEMSWADDEEGLSPDCSHLVHKLYEQAGHPYPYASSLDLYRGTGPFLRVRYAHPGDLVVWRGHVGIVMNPREHSFFSTTSSGARTENYRSAYWRARGYPHFFRYLTKSPLRAGRAKRRIVLRHRKPR